jgi:hypothetical protein
MTSGKHRKRLARQRAARTGEPYTAALLYINTRKEGLVPDPETPTATTFIACCSFCGKDNTRLEKLIAGPGVFICNECVGLCDQILATTTDEEGREVRTAYENRSAEEILEGLPPVVRNVDALEAHLRGLVARLRALGTPWSDIAARAGIGEDAARARFERS